MKSIKSILMVSVLSLCACTDAKEATRVLADSGYKDVQIKGYSWLGCSKDDVYHTEFIAKGPSGSEVNGVVCGGWLKGSTVRIF